MSELGLSYGRFYDIERDCLFRLRLLEEICQLNLRNYVLGIEDGLYGTNVDNWVHVLKAASFKRLFLSCDHESYFSVVVTYCVLRIVLGRGFYLSR